jgi:pyruvate dehydrogenase E1 component alpha subunit
MQLSRDAILSAYRRMTTIREFEERLHIENPKGEIPGFLHLYSGQEAVAVGVCEQLTDRDYIISTHRGHGHCIAKGCDVPAMMKEIYGKRDGLCNGKGGSMHIADVDKGMLGANGIVGAGQPIAVGAAIACKLRKDGSVAVSFTGDGAANQGTVFEAMNMAVVLKVPKIFVFENNGYSEHTGSSYSTGTKDLVKRIEGFGMRVFTADGFDFFSVYDAFGEALALARAGGGPVALYFETTR